VLTKHEEAYAKFRDEKLGGKGKKRITRRMIDRYIPQRARTQHADASSGPEPAIDNTIGCELRLRDEGQGTAFVKSVLAIANQFDVQLTPTSAFAKIRESLDVEAPNME
jgi:hypothetical protein